MGGGRVGRFFGFCQTGSDERLWWTCVSPEYVLVLKEGEEAFTVAMKETYVGHPISYNLTEVTESGSESQNSSPRGLQRSPWTEPY